MEYEILGLDEQPSQQPYEAQYEGVPEWIGRQLSRTGSRAAETAVGMPRAGYDIMQGLAGMIPEPIKGAVQTGLKGIDPTGGMISSLVGTLGPSLPSSENVKQTIAQTAQPGYFEPQTPGEEVADAITKTTTNILLGKAGMPIKPGSIKEGFGLIGRILSAGGKATAAASSGQASKFLAKSLGAGEFGQEATNMAVTLLTSAGLDTNIKQASQEMYTIRDNAIRPGDSIAGKNLWDPTREVRGKFLDVGIKNVKGKEEVRDVVTSLENAIGGNNRAPLEKLVPIKKQMSDAIRSVPKGSEAERWLTYLRKDLDNLLKNPEATGNKAFSQAQKAGDELYTHVKSSQAINDWARSVVASKPLLGAGVLGAVYGITTGKLGLGAAALGGLYGAAKGSNFVYSVLSNPSVRKEYMRMMQAASKQNIPLFTRSAEKLNKLMEPQYEVLELD